MEQVANRDGVSGGGSLTKAVTRRPPVSLYTMVLRTGGYTYGVGVWDLSIVQGPFSVAPCQTLKLRFATLHRCMSYEMLQRVAALPELSRPGIGAYELRPTATNLPIVRFPHTREPHTGAQRLGL
jgi:hypothetical protein